jgi:hypothetical protein
MIPDLKNMSFPTPGIPAAQAPAGPLPSILNPKFPPSRSVNVLYQVAEPLIMKITCLRSHELRSFYLVRAYVGSRPGKLRLNNRSESAARALEDQRGDK